MRSHNTKRAMGVADAEKGEAGGECQELLFAHIGV